MAANIPGAEPIKTYTRDVRGTSRGPRASDRSRLWASIAAALDPETVTSASSVRRARGSPTRFSWRLPKASRP